MTAFLVFFFCVINAASFRADEMEFTFVMAPYDPQSLKAHCPSEPGAYSGTCTDFEKVENCLSSFASALKFRSGILPTDSLEMAKRLQAFEKSTASFSDLCTAFTSLKYCMGSTFWSCLNLKSLFTLGLTVRDSHVYAQIFGQMDYKCNAGKDVIMANLRCLKSAASLSRRIASVYGKDYQNCLRDHGPSCSKPYFCRCLQHLLSYQDNVVAGKCGEIAGNVACETARAGFLHLFGVAKLDSAADCACTTKAIEALGSPVG